MDYGSDLETSPAESKSHEYLTNTGKFAEFAVILLNNQGVDVVLNQ